VSYDLVLMLRFMTTKKLAISSGGLTLISKADVPFVKIKKVNDETVPFIPGSTIKGVLRTSLIRTAHLLGFKNVNTSVYPGEKVSSSDIVTSLFGGPSSPKGKIIVDSCTVEESTGTITHVKINDKNRTAEEGGLFSVEYLPIGSAFNVKVEGRDLSLEESRALFLSILELRHERIGKSGLTDVTVIRGESKIPEELEKDPVIKEILEVTGK
jgi:CRISPR/Cas system CSM-associated protein Csm3 (group 7 of RAMP superfamily)